MAPVKRRAYEVTFKLKTIRHAVKHGNRAAARANCFVSRVTSRIEQFVLFEYNKSKMF